MAVTFEQSSKQFLASIDSEITRLQRMREQVAAVLQSGKTEARSTGVPKTREMSEEGRLRIAEAQRMRWAKQKGTAKKTSSKAVAVKKRAAVKSTSKPKPAA